MLFAELPRRMSRVQHSPWQATEETGILVSLGGRDEPGEVKIAQAKVRLRTVHAAVPVADVAEIASAKARLYEEHPL